MNENEIPMAEWSEETRQQIRKVYEPVIQWTNQHLHIHKEDVRDALHEVLKNLHNGQMARIRNWEQYLTRATIRKLRRPQTAPKIMLFSELSKEERRELFQIPAPGLNPAELTANRELLALAREGIQKLPPRQRDVLRLGLEGRTPEEIRTLLGLRSLSTVRSNQRHGIAKLRKIFILMRDFPLHDLGPLNLE